MKRNEKTERNRQIYQSREKGMYYKDIAKAHGISVTRVIQILEAESRKRKKALKET